MRVVAGAGVLFAKFDCAAFSISVGAPLRSTAESCALEIDLAADGPGYLRISLVIRNVQRLID
jgi:hypothetical protein